MGGDARRDPGTKAKNKILGAGFKDTRKEGCPELERRVVRNRQETIECLGRVKFQ